MTRAVALMFFLMNLFGRAPSPIAVPETPTRDTAVVSQCTDVSGRFVVILKRADDKWKADVIYNIEQDSHH